MTISRSFLVTGAAYLIVGIVFGAYMGASQDHTLAPVHAHINLLGFTLMTVFGLAYRLIPGLDQGLMPRLHFWLHQLGSLCLLIGLTLMMSGKIEPEVIGPVFPIFEGAILVGAILWFVLLVRRA
jgi:hypothetical protein